jgi:hypothetical protein
MAFFRFKPQENPDIRMEQFLRGRGEFSVFTDMAFERRMKRDREIKELGI